MEVRRRHISRWVSSIMLLCGLLLSSGAMGQPPVKTYTIKNGKMYIALGKQLSENSLDSFIIQYDLKDIGLSQFFKTRRTDSLNKMGWHLELNNSEMVILSKTMAALDKLYEPGERIIAAEKEAPLRLRFPAVSNSWVYGSNHFKNKRPFAQTDSTIRFFLRNNRQAKRVMLAGSFNEWDPGLLAMTFTDSGWIADVRLSPGKYWYKFIIDGHWQVDNDNQLSENDGLGNVNSVVYKTNTVFYLHNFEKAKRVYLSGSFNEWDPSGLLMSKTGNGWELPLYLTEGTYTYRFVVDDRWIEDPANPEKLPNEFNAFNSVIKIGTAHLFYLPGHTDARKVVLSGSFNQWRPDELFMRKTATGWELPYTLGPGNYEYRFLIDDKWINLHGENKSGHAFFVIQPNYTFRLKGYAAAKQVYLSGDFNNWSPDTYLMKREGDEWVVAVHLSPGKHLYKFVVDGNWIIDPANSLWEQNEHDTGNSVIWKE